MLGGKNHYPVDRDAAEQFIAVMPSVIELARADRAFLGRAVRYLADEAGIHEFLDVGTGLPTASNTHEVAQAIAPDCRVVYADNDPLVLVHAIVNELLDALPAGSYLTLTHATAEVDGDRMLDGIRRYNESGATPPLTVRSLQEIARFFDRLELLAPGVVSCSLWRPDPGELGTPVEVDLFGAVRRKP